jgi:hypothetical protein
MKNNIYSVNLGNIIEMDRIGHKRHIIIAEHTGNTRNILVATYDNTINNFVWVERKNMMEFRSNGKNFWASQDKVKKI